MLRRQFLKSNALLLSSLWVGLSTQSQPVWAASADLINPWIKLSSDNTLTVYLARSEMGQDVYTTLTMIIAEEMDHPFNLLKVETAPSNPNFYGNSLTGGAQITGSSASVRDAWDKLRKVGATARALLIQAAAEKWQVPVSQCKSENGVVKCGDKLATYGELASLASTVTLTQEAVPKATKDYKLIGKRLNRLDTPAKVYGKAEFGIDVRLPHMLSAGIEMCPIIGGAPALVDDLEARAMPGVKGIYKLPDGVAVLADDFYQVSEARKKLKIQWDTSKVFSLPDVAAIRATLEKSANTVSGYVVKQAGTAPEVNSAPARATRVEYHQPILSHAPLEPMNCSVEMRDGICHVYGPFQFQQGVSMVAQGVMGLKDSQVQVHTTFLGGGFGRKIELDCATQAILIAKLSGQSIRLTWSREDDMQHGYYRPPSLHRFAAQLDKYGRLELLTGKLVSPSVLKHLSESYIKDGVDAYMIEGLVDFIYDVPNLRLESVMQDVGVRVGFMRSVSHGLNAFAVESLLDELAFVGGQDPLSFRLNHLSQHPRGQVVLKTLAEKVGWGKPRPAGHHLGLANWFCYNSYVAVVAEVSEVDQQPYVHKLTCVIDAGLALRPNQIEAQVEGSLFWGYSHAMRNQITIKDGAVQEDNFDTYRMMRFTETPELEVHVLSTDNKPGGVGEAGVPAVAPAIANAWARVSGKRLRSMPFISS